MSETTERFFREIAARVGDDRVAEVHLFPAVRQGGMESGLAVVAAEPERVVEESLDAAPEGVAAEAEQPGAEQAETEASETELTDEEMLVEAEAAQDKEAGVQADAPAAEPSPPHRHVVYTARYRHTLKGPDRGKWEFDIKAEADAPLITIDEVVRGVVRRSGDAFHAERIPGDDFRATVSGRAARPAAPASPPPHDTPRPDTAPV